MSDENPFKLSGQREVPPNYEQIQETSPELSKKKIEELIASSDIFVFMKGTPNFPQCGFSANTMGIFQQLGKEIKTFDVLSDMGIRQGIKDFSNWPTIPQVYIKGKFVGGNDIVTEMFKSGDLEQVVSDL